MTKRPRLNRAPGRRGRRLAPTTTTPSAVAHGEQSWAQAADASRNGDGINAIARLAEAEAAFLVAGRADLAARALAQRGVLLTALEQHADAVTCLEKARAELGDWPADKIDDRARYLMAYGESLAATGDHSEAIVHLCEAMQIMAELELDVLAAGAALEISASLSVLGRHEDAAIFAEAAQLGFTTAKEPVLAAYSARVAAQAHEFDGRIHDAIAAQEVAHLTYREAGVTCSATRAVIDQSRLLCELGQTSEDGAPNRLAIERLQAVIDQADGLPAAHVRQALGRSLTDLGALEADLDRVDEAVPHLVAALDAFIAADAAIDAAETAEQLTVALRMLGRSDEALMHLGRAVKLVS
jgi:tetratricopeptide (TPR) repeat protein